LFFFFQAEDGIRDFHVTGVQTCALPILHDVRRAGRRTGDPYRRRTCRRRHAASAPAGVLGSARIAMRLLHAGHAADGVRDAEARSEERRVGKGCETTALAEPEEEK